KEGIVFKSFQSLYISNFNGEITKMAPEYVIISCHVVDGTLYVATLNHGILEFKNNKLVPKIQNAILDNAKVVCMTKNNGKLLIITALKGGFVYENNTLKPVNFEINEIIKHHQLNGFSL